MSVPRSVRLARAAGLACLASGALAAPTLAFNPFASSVISFTQGTGANAAFSNPAVALGEPSRFTPDPSFPGAVTPFAPAYKPSQVVSLGAGGQITLRFDAPVTNDPLNPYGIDLLVFGNSFFADPSFNPIATSLVGGRGVIEVSPDGNAWTTVTGVASDGLFPTLGYTDITDPFGGPAGSISTDFTKPVNPSLAWQGLGWQQLIAAYDGSGGGAGVDLGALGLSAVQFVRISNPLGSTGTVELDGLSDVSAVPAPGALAIVSLAGLHVARRRRA